MPEPNNGSCFSSEPSLIYPKIVCLAYLSDHTVYAHLMVPHASAHEES
jgi:hypothetical protein